MVKTKKTDEGTGELAKGLAADVSEFGAAESPTTEGELLAQGVLAAQEAMNEVVEPIIEEVEENLQAAEDLMKGVKDMGDADEADEVREKLNELE